MSAPWCDRWDMPQDSCAHCRGITQPNLDHVTIPTELLEAAQPATVGVVRHAVRRQPLEQLGRLLLQTAELYASLGDALTPGAGGSSDSGERVATTKVDAPMPVDARVVEHRHLLVRGLRYWTARAIIGRQAPEVGDTVPTMVAVLIGRLPDLSAEDRAELRSNLLDWRHGAGKVTAPPPVRGKVPLPAACPNADGEHWQCTGTMDLLLPTDTTRAPWLVCTECRTRLEVHELPAAADVVLPVHVVAELLDVSVRTVQRRAARDGGVVRLGDALRNGCAL